MAKQAQTQAPTTEHPTNFLARLVTLYLSLVAPDEKGVARVSVHQSFGVTTLEDGTEGKLPGVATVYGEAARAGLIASVDCPAVPAGRRWNRQAGEFEVIAPTLAAHRVPSFVEAVRLAVAEGKLIQFRVSKGWHITLPGKLTTAAKSAPGAAGVLARLGK